MKKSINIIFVIGVIIFLAYAYYSYSSGVTEYISDSFIFVGVLLGLYLLRWKFDISELSFILVIVASMLHLSGVFGWYNQSPFIIQYDHLTHIVGLFGIAAVVFDIMKIYLVKSKFVNFMLLAMMFLASLGIGSVVEQIEYLGYLKLGTGAGLLRFGGLGDTVFNEEILRAMDIIGGGWINTMLDLNYNFIGAFIGILFMYSVNKFKLNKKRKIL
ncbi:MAG: hypothetical protein AABX73_01195 [Nanoarchaeota archaeon]